VTVTLRTQECTVIYGTIYSVALSGMPSLSNAAEMLAAESSPPSIMVVSNLEIS
jgi:hypothetical protein